MTEHKVAKGKPESSTLKHTGSLNGTLRTALSCGATSPTWLPKLSHLWGRTGRSPPDNAACKLNHEPAPETAPSPPHSDQLCLLCFFTEGLFCFLCSTALPAACLTHWGQWVHHSKGGGGHWVQLTQSSLSCACLKMVSSQWEDSESQRLI